MIDSTDFTTDYVGIARKRSISPFKVFVVLAFFAVMGMQVLIYRSSKPTESTTVAQAPAALPAAPELKPIAAQAVLTPHAKIEQTPRVQPRPRSHVKLVTARHVRKTTWHRRHKRAHRKGAHSPDYEFQGDEFVQDPGTGGEPDDSSAADTIDSPEQG
jgi:hypothetical protein